jgi:cytochrome P450
LRNELKEVIGNNDITPDNVNELKFLNCVIKESLRLYPPASIVQR